MALRPFLNALLPHALILPPQGPFSHLSVCLSGQARPTFAHHFKEHAMQIERINKGEWGKVKAFFDLRTDEGLVVKGFKIVEGSNGPFVGFPSKKGGDGEYSDTVYAEAELKQAITRMAMEAYGSGIVQGAGNSADGPFEEPPPFTDDDIPF